MSSEHIPDFVNQRELGPGTQEAAREQLEKLASKNKSPDNAHTGSEEASFDQLNALRDQINQAARQKTELAATVAAPVDTQRTTFGIDRSAKKEAFNTKLREIRRELSASDRAFSKVTHNTVVNRVSEAGEKTVARPTALLWGGICACLASILLYVTAKYIGFNYNYLASIVCFAGGYITGLFMELGLRLVRHPSVTHAS